MYIVDDYSDGSITIYQVLKVKKKERQYEEGYYEISIDEISLDPNNPRHDSVKDESSVLEALLKTKNFKNKIITLM